jgi:arabinose-5-phosphate isomerase
MSQHDLSSQGLLRYARDVLQQESEAIRLLADQLGDEFLAAVEIIRNCRGMVVVTGMGKSGLIAGKISATLASTGTRSLHLHPAEAVHGDLGRIYHEDVVLALSQSGTTEEVVRLLPAIKRIGAGLIAVTAEPESPLAQHSDLCLPMGDVVEACPLGLAPTTSTSAMLALGDALALTVMILKNVSREDFAQFHPAGALGRRLLSVREVMRQGQENPTVSSGTALTESLRAMTETRAGAVSIVNQDGALVGFFTDGDLRRLLLSPAPGFALENCSIDDVMTRDPRSIGPDHLAHEALRLMKEHQLDQLPVVEDGRRPLGLLDVQDLLLVGLV